MTGKYLGMHADYETLFVSIALAMKYVSAEQAEQCLEAMEEPGAPRQIGALLRQKGLLSEEQFREISGRIFEMKEAEAGLADDISACLCLKQKLALGYHVANFREARKNGKWAGNFREFLLAEGIITSGQARELEGAWKGMVLECPGCGARYCAPEGFDADLCCPECHCVFRLPGDGPAGKPAPLHRLGHYEIEAEIGKGSMGLVFRARDADSGRLVALKTVASAGADGALLERFRREAELASSLRHASIVPVIEIGEAEGTCFIAMEYVDGRTLQDMLAHGRIPLAEALRIAVEAARAVHFANRAGVIHRDMKPGNIMVDSSGRVKICDFGLAKQRDIATITASGTIVGTPMYMSPEQATEGAAVDFRTDIYSLGATLYEAVAGVPPFLGKDVNSIIRKVKDDEPQSPLRINPSLPREIEHVILKAMEKSPANRYGSAAEMADDIMSFLSGRGVRAVPPGFSVKFGRFLKRRAEALFVLSAALTMAAVAAGLLARAGDGGSRERAGRGEWLSDLAFSALRMRSYDEAVKLYTSAIEHDPDSEAFLFRGTALVELGRVDEALSDFASARIANPANPRAWLEQGIALAAKGDLDASRESLLAAAMLGPGEAKAWMELARVSAALGRLSEASRSYLRAARVAPGSMAALRGAVESAAAGCDRRGVEEALRCAREVSPAPGGVEFLEGIAELAAGNAEGAEKLFVRAEESGFDDPDLRRLALSARLGLGLPKAVPSDLLESMAHVLSGGSASEALAEAEKQTAGAKAGSALEAELALSRGRLLLALGRTGEALAALRLSAGSGGFRCDILFAAVRALARAGMTAECRDLAASWKPAASIRVEEAIAAVDRICEASAPGKRNG